MVRGLVSCHVLILSCAPCLLFLCTYLLVDYIGKKNICDFYVLAVSLLMEIGSVCFCPREMNVSCMFLNERKK